VSKINPSCIRRPSTLSPRDVPGGTRHDVADGESWVTLARGLGMDPWKLIRYNYPTLPPDNRVAALEVNWYLQEYVKCDKVTVDGNNYMFSRNKDKGYVYLPPAPITSSIHYVVPNMLLIPQDKTMSCWYASGQMLISWRQRQTQSSELAHPDPSLVTKWSKLYDNNPGIQDSQIAEFASDLGLDMVGRMTPSPTYVRDLLQRHGPLWINGNSHITVIAGIRSAGAGYEVLVFNPAQPAFPNGAWVDFYTQYGMTPNTTIDAAPDSPTSMLYLSD
jgi:hypothetical protein